MKTGQGMDIAKKNSFKPVVITPPSSLEMPNFRELWEYRGLFFFMLRRDVKLRFQQTVVGFLWIILQPLIQVLIFYVLFGILVKVPTNGIPYHLFFLSGFIVFSFFTQVVNNSAFSLVGNIGIILKSYFPRLALPLSTIANALVDLIVSFLLLMVFMLLSGQFPITPRYLLLPVILVITIIFSSGVGLLFGALMVVFRDTKNFLNFIITIWMYITPIIYPISIVPVKYQFLLYLNPLSGLVTAFRWIFFGMGDLPRISDLSISFLVATIIWFAGAIAFRAMENKIADVM
jgi:lipopolysaccharide transport system permease protein